MFGEAVAILAAIALALSPLFFGFARFATLDPALAFFMTAALGAFYMAARARDFSRGEGRRWFVACAAMLAFGTLAKGPVAPVLCGAIALIWILIERRAGEIARMPWLLAIITYGAIAAPWFVFAAYRNPGFLRFFFVHEHVQRYLENTEHGWGPWFFIPIVIGGTWPWFFFVPLGLARIAHHRIGRATIASLGTEIPRHLVPGDFRVLLDSARQARLVCPPRDSRAVDCCGIGDVQTLELRLLARRGESSEDFRR